MKKIYLVILILIFVVGAVYYGSRKIIQASNESKFTILLDAGHGGIDSGVQGRTTKYSEAKLNLIIAKKLKSRFETSGIKIIMTRETDDGLYDSDLKSGRKKQDMQRRKEIIQNSNADIIISIHINAYPDTVSRGGQVFYKPASSESKQLAELIQENLKKIDINNKRVSKPGDFFILKQREVPAVLIECGFFSHPDEEKLLLTEEYQDKLTKSISESVLNFIALNNQ